VSNTSIEPQRRAEVSDLLSAVTSWAETRADIRAVAVVGSWARDEATMTSDLDLVVLTSAVGHYLSTDGWYGFLGPTEPVHTAEWGVLTERRARVLSGLEIEFGFAPLSWASTNPLDPGTLSVVRDGCRILHDPDDLLHALLGIAEV
jgi:predicted nucleotidyltransferase